MIDLRKHAGLKYGFKETIFTMKHLCEANSIHFNEYSFCFLLYPVFFIIILV
jgi:hypothetical protein